MKLISMTTFVQQELKGKVLYHHLEKVVNYSDFLRKPLELWMFVPCGLINFDWIVLQEPRHLFNDNIGNNISKIRQRQLYVKKYEQAKERCLFKGFTPINTNNPDVDGLLLFGEKTIYPDDFYTIEDIVMYNPELTETAIKLIL